MRGYASKVRYARIHKENVVCKDTRLLLIGTAGRKVDRHAAIRAADSLHRDADRPGKLLPLYLLGIVGVLLDAHSPCNTALRQSFVFLYQQLRQYLYFCASNASKWSTSPAPQPAGFRCEGSTMALRFCWPSCLRWNIMHV